LDEGRYYAPPLIGGGIKRWCCAVWRLTRTSGLSRTERPTKTKFGTEVAHVTLDSDTTFKFKSQRSRSPGRFTHRRVCASGSCSGGLGNVLAVGNCCYVAVCSAARGASVPTGGERGGGISWRPPAYSLLIEALWMLIFVLCEMQYIPLSILYTSKTMASARLAWVYLSFNPLSTARLCVLNVLVRNVVLTGSGSAIFWLMRTSVMSRWRLMIGCLFALLLPSRISVLSELLSYNGLLMLAFL